MRDSDAEIFGDGLAHVGQGCTSAKICAAGHARAVSEDRNVLAGMIRCGIHGIGVASVVCGDYEQIRRAQSVEKRTQQRVKFFQRAGEAFYVFAMAEEHVEIDEVCED